MSDSNKKTKINNKWQLIVNKIYHKTDNLTSAVGFSLLLWVEYLKKQNLFFMHIYYYAVSNVMKHWLHKACFFKFFNTNQVLKGLESISTIVPFTMTPFLVKLSFAVLWTTFKIGHSNSTSAKNKWIKWSTMIKRHEKIVYNTNANLIKAAITLREIHAWCKWIHRCRGE